MKTAYYFHTKWCWENDITIYPKPITTNGNVCKIVVSIKGIEKVGEEKYVAKQVSKSKYTHIELWDKIRELYKILYEKKNEPLKIM